MIFLQMRKSYFIIADRRHLFEFDRGEFRATSRIRTGDLRFTKALLYQLS